MTQIEAVAKGKPEPVISGPSQADGIARFALRAKYDDLTAERRERLKVSILDAVACAINALGSPPIEACRAQADELGGPGGRCTLVGGGRANPVYAAFYNTALIRYVDFMDSYLARGGLCHPSDNTGAILAAGEHADLSGKDFLTALAVAYQVEAQLTASCRSWPTGSTSPHNFRIRSQPDCPKRSASTTKTQQRPSGSVATSFHCSSRERRRSRNGRVSRLPTWHWGVSMGSCWRRAA